MTNIDTTPEDVLRRLHDCSDVLRAISVASKLLIEQIELITDEVIMLARLAEER
jgi:hypothetical protein